MKIRNIFVALAATAALLFASCGKDIDLKGTSWESAHTIDMTAMLLEEGGEEAAQIIQMLGGSFLMDFNLILDFTTDNAGSVTVDMRPSASMNIPDMLKPVLDMMVDTETNAMTYTFDGENGTITIDGDTENFKYNKSDKTIIMDIPDDGDELAQILGTTHLVFKQTK